ncbi:uncharacterized protein KZ484_002416 isoform 1-T2 [Pholidichthys leucotaenia]
MANETKLQTLCTFKNPADEECCENVASGEPVVSGTFSAQPYDEKVPFCHSYYFSTPLPTRNNVEGKAKSQISDLQSHQTPVLRSLDISNRAEASKQGNDLSLRNSVHYPTSAVFTGQSFGYTDASMSFLKDECLPEITFFDVTCDTPSAITSVKENLSETHSPELLKHVGKSGHGTDLHNELADPSEIKNVPLLMLEELTLLDNTSESESSLGGREDISQLDRPLPQHCGQVMEESCRSVHESPKKTILKSHGEPVKSLDIVKADNKEPLRSNDTMSTSMAPQPSGSVNNAFNFVDSTSLGMSMDLTSSTSVSDLENKVHDLPQFDINGTNVASEVIDQSVSVTTETSFVGEQNTAIKETDIGDMCNATFDTGPLGKSSTALRETERVTSPLKNNTFDSIPHSEQNGTVNLSETCAGDCHQSTSKHNGTITLSETSSGDGHANTTKQNSTVTLSEISLGDGQQDTSKQNGTLTLSERSPGDGHANTTKHNGTVTLSEISLGDGQQDTSKQKSTMTLSERSPGDGHANTTKHNGTVTLSEISLGDGQQDSSKQNGTITLSETSSGNAQPNAFVHNATMTLSKTSAVNDQLTKLASPSSPKLCSPVTSLKQSNSDISPPDSSNHNTMDVQVMDVETTETAEGHPETNPVSEGASGDGRHEASGQQVTGGMYDSLSNQSICTHVITGNALNLDETLDLKPELPITSTPVVNCEHANTERGGVSIVVAQKKLYAEDSGKPVEQRPSGVPSNLICNRKTFFTQSAAKSFGLSLKSKPQLLKSKQVSAIGRQEIGVFHHPGIKRPATHAVAVKHAAAADAHQVTTGKISSYNLRPTTVGSKLPASSLRKPQMTGIPSSIPKAAPGVKPLQAKSSATVSSTEKLCGPIATNSVAKTSQARKQPLSKGDALPSFKRKRMDAQLAALPACNGTANTKNLKQPSQRAFPVKDQRNGCARCIDLQEQLKMKSEEIRKLKEGCADLEEQLKIKSEELRKLKEVAEIKDEC